MSDTDQPAQNGPLSNYLGIGMNISGTACIACQFTKIVQTPGPFQFIEAIQGFHQGHYVNWASRLTLLGHDAKNKLMLRTVKIFCQQHIGQIVPFGVIQHQPPEHGLLSIYRMRRNLERGDVANFSILGRIK